MREYPNSLPPPPPPVLTPFPNPSQITPTRFKPDYVVITALIQSENEAGPKTPRAFFGGSQKVGMIHGIGEGCGEGGGRGGEGGV